MAGSVEDSVYFESIDEEPVTNNIPPHAADVEVAVLGAMMRHEAAADRSSVRAFLKSEHFYNPTHQKIYEAMCAIGDRDEPIDLVTVKAELERNHTLNACGGIGALIDIADSVFTAANAEAHGRIVLELAIRRQMIAIGRRVTDQAISGPGDITEFIESLQSQVTQITIDSQAGMKGVAKMSELTSKASALIDDAQAGKQVGICGTGIRSLDRKIRALREQDLIVIAARPSMGKTSLACDIIMHVARQGIPCAFFSIESGATPIVTRMACAEAKVSLVEAMNGGLSNDEVVALSDAFGRIHTLPIWIDSSGQLSNTMFASRAQKMVRGFGVRVIAVDYVQQMDGPAKSENKHHEVSAIIQTLKAVAHDLNVCVIALSQMNRDTEKRGKGQGAELSNMRESGKIEEVADIVLFPEVAWPADDTPEEQMPSVLDAKLRIKKHRNGPKGMCHCLYLPKSLTFVNQDWSRNADQRTA